MILPERNISPASRSDGRPKHRGLIIFIALLILVLAGYGVWWYLLAEQTRAHIDAWFEDVRAQGHEADYDDLQIFGFPSQIALEIQNFQFNHANGQWRVTLPHAKANGIPWQLDRVKGHIGVPISIQHTRGTRTDSYAVSSTTNSFDVTLNGAGIFSFKMSELTVTGSSISQPIMIETFMGALSGGNTNVFLQASIKADGIKLPDPQLSPFGDEIALLVADIDVDVRPNPAPSLPEQLDTWRRAGGALEVRRLTVRHGVLGLDGDGTITLDRNLQPEGAFGASVSGFNPAVDALIAQGLVPKSEGQLAKAALGLFAKAPLGGGPKTIDIPLTVQEGRLSVGPFPLMRIPRIYWD
jgi:hypothetical protein